MTLAIGCGGNREYPNSTLRDVNLDIRLPYFCIENFVLADAMHLPFREKAFRRVYGAHITEHLADPEAFIRECRRVGESLELSFPRWISVAAYLDPTHRWVWFAGRFRPIPQSLRQIVRFVFANRFADFIFSHVATTWLGEIHTKIV
ncbi:class I SAM-dependent methyltransferase [Candidatus Bathyarchaeota archaeon]|nr:class I SAM-dependent methyltransferase [Candidatus Bathyarchaeota archaeon]